MTTIELPLSPAERIALRDLAAAKGMSTPEFVHEAIVKILAEAPTVVEVKKKPTKSARGIMAKYGTAPSAEEIDQNRAEMLANFPRDDY